MPINTNLPSTTITINSIIYPASNAVPNVMLQDYPTISALDYCIWWNDVAQVRTMLSLGANPNRRLPIMPFAHGGKYANISYLMYAVLWNYTDLVLTLLEFGANTLDEYFPITPKALPWTGAVYNDNLAQQWSAHTLLGIALWHENPRIVGALFEKGLDPRTRVRINDSKPSAAYVQGAEIRAEYRRHGRRLYEAALSCIAQENYVEAVQKLYLAHYCSCDHYSDFNIRQQFYEIIRRISAKEALIIARTLPNWVDSDYIESHILDSNFGTAFPGARAYIYVISGDTNETSCKYDQNFWYAVAKRSNSQDIYSAMATWYLSKRHFPNYDIDWGEITFDNLEQHAGVAYFLLGEYYRNISYETQAQLYFDKAIELGDNATRAKAYYEKGRLLPSADRYAKLTCFAHAFILGNNQARQYLIYNKPSRRSSKKYELAKLLYNHGHPALAYDWFHASQPESSHYLGEYYRQGLAPVAMDYLKAIEHYNNAINYHNPSTNNDSAAACMTAQEGINRIFAVNTLSAELIFNIGQFFFNQGSYSESLRWITRAKELNHPGAACYYGRFHHQALGGILANFDIAFEMYNIALNGNYSEVQQQLNNLFETIESAEQLFRFGHYYYQQNNYQEAYRWFDKAKTLQHPQAIAQIGEYFHQGYSPVTKNFVKAFEHYQLAKNLGFNSDDFLQNLMNDPTLSPRRILTIALRQLDNNIEAKKWLIKLVSYYKTNNTSMFLDELLHHVAPRTKALIKMLVADILVEYQEPADIVLACRYYQEAADFAHDADDDVLQESAEAKLSGQLAQVNEPATLCAIAKLYYHLPDSPTPSLFNSPQKARRWFAKAEQLLVDNEINKLTQVQTLRNIGRYIELGHIADKTFIDVAHFYQMAFDRDEEPVDEDFERLFNNPALSTLDIYSIGDIRYQSGELNSVNYQQAIRWYGKLVEHDDDLAAKACWRLGCCYQAGHGVDKNLFLAGQYFLKAYQKGLGEAKACLEAILNDPLLEKNKWKKLELHSLLVKEALPTEDFLNELDFLGNTPLHRAARRFYKTTAHLLFLGANRTVCNNQGEEPLQALDKEKVSTKITKVYKNLQKLTGNPCAYLANIPALNRPGLQTKLTELFENPTIRPIIQCIYFSLLGYNSYRAPLQIDTTALPQCLALSSSLVNLGNNLITVTISRDLNESLNGFLAELFSRFTTYVMQETFKNSFKPYYLNDEMWNQFRLRVDLSPQALNAIDEELRPLYTYLESEEKISRLIPELVKIIVKSPDGQARVEEQAPELMHFFDNHVLPHMTKHIAKIEKSIRGNYKANWFETAFKNNTLHKNEALDEVWLTPGAGDCRVS